LTKGKKPAASTVSAGEVRRRPKRSGIKGAMNTKDSATQREVQNSCGGGKGAGGGIKVPGKGTREGKIFRKKIWGREGATLEARIKKNHNTRR